MNRTIEYYNQNAEEFINGTISVEFSETQNRFLKTLRSGAKILDFGCGSGRDTKFFLTQGFNVDATDGSIEMCRISSQYTGIPVRHMLFSELDSVNEYDGIWACSSILHLPKDELKCVLKKLVVALKNEGILYTSFKYGSFDGVRGGRYFTDFTESAFEEFIIDIRDFSIEEYWVSNDVRPDRQDEKWLNLIMRKRA